MAYLDSIKKEQEQLKKDKDLLNQIGFEILGSKRVNGKIIYFVKKRNNFLTQLVAY